MKKATVEKLKEELIKNLRLDFFEEEEISSVLEEIDSFDPKVRQKILALCFNLSNASSSLVPSSLRKIKAVFRILSSKELDLWLKNAFELLDSHGIDPFLSFISKIGEEDLRKFKVKEGIYLKDFLHILQRYLYGISGADIEIRSNQYPFADLKAIYLPSRINRFIETEKNFLLLKLITVHLWKQTVVGTLRPEREIYQTFIFGEVKEPNISHMFSNFNDRNLAIDIFNILEAFRIDNLLRQELPGLMRDSEIIKKSFFDERPELPNLSEKSAITEALYQFFLNRQTKGNMPQLKGILRSLPPKSLKESVYILFDLYKIAERLRGQYQERHFFFGTILPEKVAQSLNAEKKARKKKLESIISKIINMPEFEPKRPPSKDLKCDRPDPEKDYLVIKSRIFELDEESKKLIEEKEILGGVLVKGSDLGGGCSITFLDLAEEEEIKGVGGGIRYDEWDFKRGDYKKNWCSLYEIDIHQGHEPFVEQTLKKYSGYVNILKKKFELLKKEPRLLKRQRDGEDIDLDATVEAFSDIKAGIFPSDKIFTRFDKQERNIAVLFLVDMSGSTKGWVNDAEKEALVLMCEALEALGDRYGIYGFSGMTRSKCEFYKIKDFEETYSEIIKRRIAGISPKDYTRMGVAIRHATKKLRSIEARSRLLITISDGKPEDWDGYKGEYGIEDTKKSLIESKEVGIHPFCITIDKEAQSYLPHMFGTNYIFIDDVRKLPLKITDVYRRLTRQ